METDEFTPSFIALSNLIYGQCWDPEVRNELNGQLFGLTEQYQNLVNNWTSVRFTDNWNVKGIRTQVAKALLRYISDPW